MKEKQSSGTKWSLHFVPLFLALMLNACHGQRNMDDSKSNEVTKEEMDLPENAIPDRLILQLASGVAPQEVVDEFSDIGMKFIETASLQMRSHVFTYDTDRIPPDKVLETVSSSRSVLVAQFDKTLDPRN